MAGQVWFFAYGANMSTAAMRSRSGEIADVQVATLPNYELVFNKKARGGSATANIRPASGSTLYGVLFRIPEAALRTLDRFEGAPEHYRRIEISVLDGRGSPVSAQAYIATKIEKGLRPAPHYIQSILEAAAEHHFPAEYVDRLKKTAGAA
ncbi:MAG TPA: gamma-glutamylcyclotransferase family protein [Candidatus Acidoferrales bacterium]|nr:gamma-glutamylcyclotransferase family protein [Candidatus Acidoferrales bacterium]